MLVAAQIPAADFHFLAGELVLDHIHFQTRISSVFSFRITADHIVKRRISVLSDSLIAADVYDLFEVANANQIIGVDRLLIARVERDVTAGCGDSLLIVT